MEAMRLYRRPRGRTGNGDAGRKVSRPATATSMASPEPVRRAANFTVLP